GVVRDGDSFTVEVPSWRATKDISLKADLVEELTRIYGYDNFVVKPTHSLLRPVRDAATRTNDRLWKDTLVLRHSFHEVHTYLWCDEKKYRNLGFDVEDNVTLVNGAADNSILRNSILPSLLIIAGENKDFAESYGLFEIGRVVTGVDKDGMCVERRTLGVVLYAKGAEEEAIYQRAVAVVNDLFVEAKQAGPTYRKTAPKHNWQHPKNTSAIVFGDAEVGTIGTLHPQNLDMLDKNAVVAWAEIDMEVIDGTERAMWVYHEPSRFPAIDYDLTIRLGEDSDYSRARAIIDGQQMADLADVRVADVYRREASASDEQGGQSGAGGRIDAGEQGVQAAEGHGRHGANVTVRLRFSSPEKTLVREDVQARVDSLIEAWKQAGIYLG
ncbi:MAG: hypothetical protein FWF83_08855, partial [Clostridiales bacterium]|nr:hypothetical protein [Clostridiales bacterium]